MTQLTEFQETFLQHLNYRLINNPPFISYVGHENERSEYIHFFSKSGAYDLILAEYTIPSDFELNFQTKDCQLRFGLVFEGQSEFELVDKPKTHFLPAPFIAIEDHLKGRQKWKKGQHYRGIEIFIHFDYIQALNQSFTELDSILNLTKNHAILYLPLGIIDILRSLEKSILNGSLTALGVEAKIIECLDLICTEIANSDANAFHDPLNIRQINISSERTSQLTSEDIKAIHTAKELIDKHLDNPPTIHEMSKQLYINEQKLAVGFKELYHVTIGNYIKELRLSTAANLLSSTDLSIDEISQKVGYSHASNLGKAFKSKYKRTPFQYRKFRSRGE